jgi:hypothetical protein
MTPSSTTGGAVTVEGGTGAVADDSARSASESDDEEAVKVADECGSTEESSEEMGERSGEDEVEDEPDNTRGPIRADGREVN